MNRYLLLLGCLGMIAVAGCGGGEDATPAAIDARATSFQDSEPRDYLAAVFGRYRNAAAYSDRAEVRLLYQQDGQTLQQVAPLKIWLDHHQLYVEAYDVRLWSDETSLTGWIIDPDSNQFDSQVLRRPLQPGRPKLENLFEDPVLIDRIAAGLAGPPPQLEWLFAKEPMKELFAGDFSFQFGPSRSIEGMQCESVIVTAGQQRYVFWIDRSQSLVRRIELPPVVAPLNSGEPPQSMPLILELTDATFSSGIAPQPTPLPATPRYVAHFVPLPPPPPDRLIGETIRELTVTTQSGPIVIGDRPVKERATLLIRYDGDPVSQNTLVSIEQWRSRMPPQLKRQIEIIVLMQPQTAKLPPWCSLPATIDRSSLAERTFQLQSGESVLLSGDGQIQWVQDPIAWQEGNREDNDALIYLGAIVGDLLQGVNVAERLAEQWQEQMEAYQQALKQQTIKPN